MWTGDILALEGNLGWLEHQLLHTIQSLVHSTARFPPGHFLGGMKGTENTHLSPCQVLRGPDWHLHDFLLEAMAARLVRWVS